MYRPSDWTPFLQRASCSFSGPFRRQDKSGRPFRPYAAGGLKKIPGRPNRYGPVAGRFFWDFKGKTKTNRVIARVRRILVHASSGVCLSVWPALAWRSQRVKDGSAAAARCARPARILDALRASGACLSCAYAEPRARGARTPRQQTIGGMRISRWPLAQPLWRGGRERGDRTCAGRRSLLQRLLSITKIVR